MHSRTAYLGLGTTAWDGLGPLSPRPRWGWSRRRPHKVNLVTPLFLSGNVCTAGWDARVPSDLVANLELGARLEVRFPSFPSPPLLSLLFSGLPLPCRFLPSFLPSLPLEVSPLNLARGRREHCKCTLPNEIWGRAPAEIEFGVL